MSKRVELHNKRVTIVGLGRSAVGAVRLLLREGAIPFVTDAAEVAPEYAKSMDALGVAYECNGHTSRALDADTSLVVASPGVPATIPLLQEARERGIPVIAELELGWRYCDSPVLAVTGTNGKTTTTALLHAMLCACGKRTALAGNNETPLSEAVLADAPWDYVVAEVSSYQLETVETFRPWIAVVLNLTPDHLGRHGDMAGYAAAKAAIFKNMSDGDVAVLNADDAHANGLPVPDGVRGLRFSAKGQIREGALCVGAHPPVPLASLKIPGRHNAENALAALCMADAGGFDWDAVVGALQKFDGVEHRIEFVAEVDGVPFYNDSKSTNVDSLRVALESFPGKRIVLIAGGRGKGTGYSGLCGQAKAALKFMVTIGEEAPRLEQDLGETVVFSRADNMENAVAAALANATAGDVVLLSPGCASFDWYRNYEERGRDFKACVQELAQRKHAEVER